MRFGDFEIHFLTGGTLKLDASPVFGIVPKPLWEGERQAGERWRQESHERCGLKDVIRHTKAVAAWLQAGLSASQASATSGSTGTDHHRC